MQQPSCAYACARISALENGLLDRRAVKRMADGSLEDAMRVLLDARYGNLPDATASDCERMIENVRAEAAREIRAISPKPELTDLFLLETDVHNLKLLIKARLLEQAEVLLLLGGLYEPEQLKAAVAEQEYGLLPAALADALDALEERLRVEAEPQRVSIALDCAYLSYALETARRNHDAFAAAYFTALCDFDNVITLLRLRAMGAAREELHEALLPEGGVRHEALLQAFELSDEALLRALSASPARDAIAAGLADMQRTGSIGALERAREDYLLSLVRPYRHDIASVQRLVGYLLARDREARAVRMIVTVKRNGLDDAVMQERLCELYG